MFKKANRLTTKEFSHYFKVGKRHHFPHLTVVYSQLEVVKVSVVVGKKVAKSAVKRNLLKRRVLAELRKLNPQPGAYIILLKPSFVTLPRKTTQQTIREAIALLVKSE